MQSCQIAPVPTHDRNNRMETKIDTALGGGLVDEKLENNVFILMPRMDNRSGASDEFAEVSIAIVESKIDRTVSKAWASEDLRLGSEGSGAATVQLQSHFWCGVSTLEAGNRILATSPEEISEPSIFRTDYNPHKFLISTPARHNEKVGEATSYVGKYKRKGKKNAVNPINVYLKVSKPYIGSNAT